jgi:very-short-patch-repair endonuclease
MTLRARRLRGNMTDAEYKLWHALRRDQILGLNFRRQHPLGRYTIDFYCPSVRLAVEVDGGQHGEQGKGPDERRTRWLMDKGIIVVRYWNNDILTNLEGVLADLVQRLEHRAQTLTPSLTLPLSGGGNREAVP